MKKNKHSQRNRKLLITQIYILTGALEGKEIKWQEKYLKHNSWEWNTNLQIQEAQRTPSAIMQRDPHPDTLYSKMLKAEERILNVAREKKWLITFKGTP